MRDRFADYHPLVNLLFFALTVTFSMVSMNPVCLLISLFASGAYSCLPDRGEHFRRMALWLVPMFLMALLINPAFNHRGVTALAYLPTGNILTLESILYGAAAGIMVVAVVLWFYSFTRVVTTDKLVYLFGHVTPSLSLLLTLTLRFVPRFTNHYRLLREAQTGLGAAEEKRGFKASVREMAALLSALINWAVENASDADSAPESGQHFPTAASPGRTRWSWPGCFAGARSRRPACWAGKCISATTPASAMRRRTRQES